MKQLLILSGKGGTGKTTVASAFIKLAKARAFADCDVDAPNLHLLLSGTRTPGYTDFYGMPTAELEQDKCIHCGICHENCRFDAVRKGNGLYTIDRYSCEGCGLCAALCPAKAIEMKPAVAGELMLYQDEEAVFSTTQLRMGSGTSGKLVTAVKQQMSDSAAGAELAIIDGSPGIGCPVIASMSGVDLVLMVAEPSLSGLSDLERVLQTAAHFGTKAVVCINKYDINLKNTAKIEMFCHEYDIPCIGKIPFDPDAGRAINQGLSVVDIDCPSGKAMAEVFERAMEQLQEVIS